MSLVLTRNSEPFVKYLQELVIQSSNSHLNEDRKLWIVFLAASELFEGQTINDLMVPWWLRSKESACNGGDLVRSLGWEDPRRRVWQPTPVFLPGESPWAEEPGGIQSMGSDTTE